MNKKLQVFVSSTYTDLIEERQAAVQAILDAGHIPAGMELFKAGKSQMQTIKKWIDESDVYMLILGGRYGSIEEESGLSYTELEYRYALSKNMPFLPIVLDDSFLHTKAASEGASAIFEEKNVNKYNKFKADIKKKIVPSPKNLDQISTIIHSNLNGILNDPEYELIGWTRQYANSDSTKLITENKSLKEELQKLQNELNTMRLPQNAKINKTKKRTLIDDFLLLSDHPREVPYDLLKQTLSSINITYNERAYSALDFFRIQYIDKRGVCAYIQENAFDGVFLCFEKYGLVVRTKSERYTLYIFNLSNRGTEFCNYLTNI